MIDLADKLDFLAKYKTREGIRKFPRKTFLIEMIRRFRSTSPINKFNVSNYSILIALSLLKRDVIDLQLCQNKEQIRWNQCGQKSKAYELHHLFQSRES